jgi:hypothetical protein
MQGCCILQPIDGVALTAPGLMNAFTQATSSSISNKRTRTPVSRVFVHVHQHLDFFATPASAVPGPVWAPPAGLFAGLLGFGVALLTVKVIAPEVQAVDAIGFSCNAV